MKMRARKKRLEARIEDYEKAFKNATPKERRGWKRPGSMKK